MSIRETAVLKRFNETVDTYNTGFILRKKRPLTPIHVQVLEVNLKKSYESTVHFRRFNKALQKALRANVSPVHRYQICCIIGFFTRIQYVETV